MFQIKSKMNYFWSPEGWTPKKILGYTFGNREKAEDIATLIIMKHQALERCVCDKCVVIKAKEEIAVGAAVIEDIVYPLAIEKDPFPKSISRHNELCN